MNPFQEDLIPFDNLIEDYKNQHNKGLKTLYSKHLFTCFNPQNQNQVITLNYNHYPKDTNYKSLKPKPAEDKDKEKEKNPQPSEEQNEKSQNSGQNSYQSEQENKRILRESANSDIGCLVDHTLNEDGIVLKRNKDFQHFLEFEIDPSEPKYSYSVSIWEYNDKIHSTKLREFCFNGSPYGLNNQPISNSALIFGSQYLYVCQNGTHNFFDINTWDIVWSFDLSKNVSSLETLHFQSGDSENQSVYIISDIDKNKINQVYKVQFKEKINNLINENNIYSTLDNQQLKEESSLVFNKNLSFYAIINRDYACFYEIKDQKSVKIEDTESKNWSYCLGKKSIINLELHPKSYRKGDVILDQESFRVNTSQVAYPYVAMQKGNHLLIMQNCMKPDEIFWMKFKHDKDDKVEEGGFFSLRLGNTYVFDHSYFLCSDKLSMRNINYFVSEDTPYLLIYQSLDRLTIQGLDPEKHPNYVPTVFEKIHPKVPFLMKKFTVPVNGSNQKYREYNNFLFIQEIDEKLALIRGVVKKVDDKLFCVQTIDAREPEKISSMDINEAKLYLFYTTGEVDIYELTLDEAKFERTISKLELSLDNQSLCKQRLVLSENCLLEGNKIFQNPFNSQQLIQEDYHSVELFTQQQHSKIQKKFKPKQVLAQDEIKKLFVFGNFKGIKQFQDYENPILKIDRELKKSQTKPNSINQENEDNLKNSKWRHDNSALLVNTFDGLLSMEKGHLGSFQNNQITPYDKYASIRPRIVIIPNPISRNLYYETGTYFNDFDCTYIDDNFIMTKKYFEDGVNIIHKFLSFEYKLHLNYDYIHYQTKQEMVGPFKSKIKMFKLSENMQYMLFSNINCIDTQVESSEKIMLLYKIEQSQTFKVPTLRLVYNFQKTHMLIGYYNYRNVNFLSQPVVTDNGDYVFIHTIGSERDYIDKEIVKQLFIKNNEPYDKSVLERFDLVESKLKNNELLPVKNYQIVGDMLFIIEDHIIEYAKLFPSAQERTKRAQRINLSPSFEMKVRRITATSNQNAIQIVFTDDKQGLSIVTWDLKLNREIKSFNLVIPDDPVISKYLQENCQIWVDFMFRGTGKNQNNYFLTPDNYIYDLTFGLPISQLKNYPYQNKLSMSTNFAYLTEDCMIFLTPGNLIHQYSLYDLFFMRNKVQNPKAIEFMRVQNMDLDTFNRRYPVAKNIFHQFSLNSHFLSLVQEKLRLEQQDDNHKNLSMLLYILSPNDFKVTPFDHAVKALSSRNVELMLSMVSSSQIQNTSNYLKQHFSSLISMDIEAFVQYLEDALSFPIRMNQGQNVYWDTDESQKYFATNSNFISQKQLLDPQLHEHNFKPQSNIKDKKIDQAIPKQAKRAVSKDFNPNQLEWYQDIPKNTIVSQSKLARAEVKLLSFDWILDNTQALNFFTILANSGNSNLFTIQSIKVIVLYYWQNFFYQIRNKVFFPFIAYLVFFQVYATYIYEKNQERIEQNKIDSAGTSKEGLAYFYELDKFFIAMIISFICYFGFLEVNQIYMMRASYFNSIWSLFDLISINLNIAYIGCCIADIQPTKLRPLAAIAVLFMWIKFFYFLRIFRSTSSLIRMIMEICKDMAAFSLILLIAMVGFANVLYILAINVVSVGEGEELFTGSNFLLAIIYSFRLGLGDFSTEGFGETYDQIIWIVFLLEAMLIQIVLLNLLIAIMGDTFSKVTEIQEQLKLEEICKIIVDNRHIITPSKELSNGRYIAVATLETIANQQGAQWEGQVSALKYHIQNEEKKIIKYFKTLISGIKIKSVK
ncbi:wd-40 repeat protein [Stylonychia lemnae]|uniref:Wd-40 repeat protein n=1 Tax=Stylonychia lemnae TaxID=5949 RepID=A0A078APF1_STYLE|nr:wd-40 repeat protein [Stylonychia lemnae]|eukprot:CDW84245.1 wd-40 repeat protein [Stylonychia lemnae]